MTRSKYLDENVVFVCTKRKCGAFVLIFGLSLAIGGIIGLIVAPIATRQQAAQTIPLTENSFAATQWIDPPYIVTMQFWIFNTTNPDEVLRGKQKPSVAEKGPYTYKQKNQKNQVVYGNDDNVSYIETNVFFFDQSRSCSDCHESDVFTVPNALYTTIAQMLRFQNEDLKRATNLALLLLSERPFMTRNVYELLFNGYEDELLTIANGIKQFVPKLGELNLPKIFQYFPKNNTNDGRYEITVGKSDVKQMAHIRSWNGKKNLTWWNDDEANKIEGTDAQLFSPFIKRADKLPIFVSDMCRSAYLQYVSDMHENGLQVYRFVLPPETFNTFVPGNKGFCIPTDKYFPSQLDKGYSCLPAGLLNLSTCRNTPILLSKPHFLHAADEVIQSVDGMKPSMDHELTWDIQPTFGSAVAVKTKLQLSVPIYPDPFFWSIKLVKPSIIPLFWFNASALADEGTKTLLYNNVVILQTVGYAATFAVLLFGVVFLLLLIACCCSRPSHKGRWSTQDRGHSNHALIEETVINTSTNNTSQRKV